MIEQQLSEVILRWVILTSIWVEVLIFIAWGFFVRPHQRETERNPPGDGEPSCSAATAAQTGASGRLERPLVPHLGMTKPHRSFGHVSEPHSPLISEDPDKLASSCHR